MPLKSIQTSLPAVTDNKDGTVSIKFGALTYTEGDDDPFFSVPDEREGKFLAAKLYCFQELGFNTWREMLDSRTGKEDYTAVVRTVRSE